MLIDQLHQQFVPWRIRSDRVRHRASPKKIFLRCSLLYTHTDTPLIGTQKVSTIIARAPSLMTSLPIWDCGIQLVLLNLNNSALSVRTCPQQTLLRMNLPYSSFSASQSNHCSPTNLSSFIGYPGTDVFIICFSIFQPQSFRNVYEQVRNQTPDFPLVSLVTVLVQCKMDRCKCFSRY